MAQLQTIAANNEDAERSLADLKVEVSIAIQTTVFFRL